MKLYKSLPLDIHQEFLSCFSLTRFFVDKFVFCMDAAATQRKCISQKNVFDKYDFKYEEFTNSL